MPGLELWTTAFVLDLSIKAALLSIAAWAGMAVCRVRGIHLRHRVWVLVLAGMLSLPALVHLAPSVSLPYWLYPNLQVASVSGDPTAMSVESPAPNTGSKQSAVEPASPEPIPAAPAPISDVVPSSSPQIVEEETSQATAPPMPTYEVREASALPVGALPSETPRAMARNRSAVAILLVYLLGVVVQVARLLVGVIWTASLVRRTRPIDTPLAGKWLPSWARLAESSEVRVPVTVGYWRPVVVLPADWTEWDETFLTMVLAHEGEHVRRRDTSVSLLAALNCAVYWFHPVAWLVRRRLTDLAEQACDDEVIRITGNRGEYAQNLLEMAGRLAPRSGRLQPIGVAMARKANVVKRIEAIIDRDRPLSQRLGTLVALLLLCVVVPLIFLAAGLRGADSSVAAEAESDVTEGEALGNAHEPDSPARSIAGTVVMAGGGKPVAGVEVHLRCGKPDGTYVETKICQSKERGEFAFENLGEGKYRVLAFHRDLASRTKRLREGQAKPGDTSIRLELRKAPSLHVKVVARADGKPIAGALVQLPFTDTKQDHVCDENGEVTIRGLTPEAWRLEVRAKGYAEQKHALNLHGTETARVTAELDLGAELVGTVRDETGTGLAGVGINAYQANLRGIGLDYVKTDEEGNYRFEYLPIDKLKLYVSQDGYVKTEPTVTMAVPPGQRQEFHITLLKRPYGGAVRGVVVDADGSPISGATINNHGGSSKDVRSTKTRADGSFLIEDAFKTMTGHYLVVKARGFSPQLVPFSPGTKDEPAEVRVTLDPGHFIRGKVVDESGDGIAGVRIAAGKGAAGAGRKMAYEAETDEEGSFQFDSLQIGTPFELSKEGYSQIRDGKLTLDDEETVVVTMLSEGVIRGRVVDDMTGKPVSPFTVRATFSPDRTPADPSFSLGNDVIRDGNRFKGPDGNFRMGDFIRGAPLQIMVEADGYDRKVVRRVDAAGEADAKPVEVRLSPVDPSSLLSIAGQMVNEQSKPMPGVQLRLIVTSKGPDPRDRYPFNWTRIRLGNVTSSDSLRQFLTATTDGDGRFRFRDVRGGNDIELAYWGSGVSEDRVEHLERLSPEELAELTVRCRAPGAVRGAIAPDAFPEISRICLSSEREIYYGNVSAGRDSYEFQDVPEDRYELQVYGAVRPSVQPGAVTNNVTRRIPVDVVSGETVTLDLRAKPKNRPQPDETDQAALQEPSRPRPAPTSVASKDQEEPETAKEPPAPTDSSEDAGSTITVAGKVTDESGKAIEGARLFLPVAHDDERVAEAITDASGEFSLGVPKAWTKPGKFYSSWTVWCYAPGHQLAIAPTLARLKRDNNPPLNLTLKSASNTSLVIEAPDGSPIHGARVEPLHLSVAPLPLVASLIIPDEIRDFLAKESDPDGRVFLPEIPRDRLASVQITAERYGTQQMRLWTAPDETPTRTIRLRTTGRLEGQLLSDEKRAIANTPILVRQSDFAGKKASGTAVVETDDDGRFVVPAVATGPIRLGIHVDKSLPLRPRIPEGLKIQAGKTTSVQIPFEKPVRVHGRVQTHHQGTPIAGAQLSVQTNGYQQHDQVQTNADGLFETNVVSGEMSLQLIMKPKGYSTWVESPAWPDTFDVPAGANSFALPILELAGPATRTGRLIDQTDRPVANATVAALVRGTAHASSKTDENGSFTLNLPPEFQVDEYGISLPSGNQRPVVTVKQKSPLLLQIDD